MAINSGEVVRVSVRLAQPDGSDHVNVFHYKANNTITNTDESIMAFFAAHYDAIYAYIEDWQKAGMTGIDVKADVIEWLGGKWVLKRPIGLVSLPNVNYDPDGATDALPFTTAAVLLMRTLGPRVLGKKYIGGLVEAAQAAGQLVFNAASAFLDWADQIQAVINLTGGDLVLCVPSTVTGATWAVVEIVLSFYLGVQRRRRQDIGT